MVMVTLIFIVEIDHVRDGLVICVQQPCRTSYCLTEAHTKMVNAGLELLYCLCPCLWVAGDIKRVCVVSMSGGTLVWEVVR